MTEAGKAFSDLMGGLDPPVFVVTVVADDDGEKSGCLVGFGTQVSIRPGHFLACISEKNHTATVMPRASHVAVHVLDDDQRELAELFGGKTGDEVDKFAECSWSEGPAGVPILAGVEAWFVGRIVRSYDDFGDHVGYLLRPIDTEVDGEPGGAFSLQEARSIEAGHEA